MNGKRIKKVYSVGMCEETTDRFGVSQKYVYGLFVDFSTLKEAEEYLNKKKNGECWFIVERYVGVSDDMTK